MSSKFATRPESLWQAIGGFGAIADWHPAIEKAVTGPEGADTIRKLSLVGGGMITEKLETLNARERLYTYSIVDSPLPVMNYTAEIKVTDNGDGTSTVTWTGTFDPSVPDASVAVKTIEGIYKAGLENMQKLYGMGR